MSNLVAMCIGGGIGSVVGATFGFLLASMFKVGAQADRQAELAKSRRNDAAELAQMFDKKA